MLSCHMLLSPLTMYSSHSAIALLPSSRCLTPLLINTSTRFLFAPSFHFMCFWSTRIFQEGSCAQAVKIHPHKCSKATPLLFLLSCEGGGGFCRNCVWHLFSFWSGWPSIRTTVHVPLGCLSPWQPESGRPQQEDGGKIERRLRRNTCCTVSVNTLNIHRTSSVLNRRNKKRERMEPKRGIICEMRAGNPSQNVLISQKMSYARRHIISPGYSNSSLCMRKISFKWVPFNFILSRY